MTGQSQVTTSLHTADNSRCLSFFQTTTSDSLYTPRVDTIPPLSFPSLSLTCQLQHVCYTGGRCWPFVLLYCPGVCPGRTNLVRSSMFAWWPSNVLNRRFPTSNATSLCGADAPCCSTSHWVLLSSMERLTCCTKANTVSVALEA